MEGVLQYIRYSPIGEYLRLLIMKRLTRGPATIEEVNELAKKAVERIGMKYDWRVWPKLFTKEVEIKGGIAVITSHGRWVLEQTSEEVTMYVQKWLGISP